MAARGLMTTEEMALALDVSQRTIRAWVSQGIIPVVRITPRTLRFDWGSVLRALGERQVREKRASVRHQGFGRFGHARVFSEADVDFIASEIRRIDEEKGGVR